MFNLFKKKDLKTINKEAVGKEIAKYGELGVTNKKSDVIISLTSFPQRMYEIHYTLYSLLTQTVKPAEVVLWLGEEQFPNLENDIPKEVLKLKKNGLSIKWYKNLYSYTKLIPALAEYPDRVIVTVDDDIYYENNFLEKLIEAHKQYPNYIISHRAHKVKFNKNTIAPYKKWKKCISNSKASYLNFLTGVGGVLYPPKCLYKDILNEELFTKLAPKADDVWFWAMAILNKTKTYIPQKHISSLTYVNPERERGLSDEITLFSSNKKGGNDIQIANVINHYPQIIDILQSE